MDHLLINQEENPKVKAVVVVCISVVVFINIILENQVRFITSTDMEVDPDDRKKGI